MSAPVYVLGGYQTDFARNWNKEGKDFSDAFAETVAEVIAALRAPIAELQAHLGLPAAAPTHATLEV